MSIEEMLFGGWPALGRIGLVGGLAYAGLVLLLRTRRAGSVKDRLTSHEVKTFKAVNLRLITVAIVPGTLTLMASTWILV